MQLTKDNTNFTDISLSFKPNPLNGDITILKDERAISNALKNVVMIAVYERPFDSLFGSNVSKVLFEPADTMSADDLEYEIRRTILRNEPRVRVKDVRVNINYDTGHYDVTIVYVIIGFEEVLTLDFILTPTTT